MSRASRVLAVLLIAIGVAAAAAPAQARPAGADVRRSLAEVRRATARYHDVNKAVADGYVPTQVCVPQMGLHYLNPPLLDDPALDPTKPEIIIYAPGPNGKLRLVAVEWWSADLDQDLATDAGRPSLFGVPFDGPMPGHHPGMPVHFDLHAWIWKHNPAGMFTAFNPTVSCPG